MHKGFFIFFLSLAFILGCAKKPEPKHYEEYEEEEVVEEEYEFPMIDEDAEFEGVIDTDGDFTVKGKLKGVLIATGLVLIDETGIVECDSIVATNVIVKGHVKGTIKALNEIRVDTTGIVIGNTLCRNLVVNGGSIFDAKSAFPDYKERRTK